MDMQERALSGKTAHTVIVDDPYEDMANTLREKILFGLAIYPAMSPSMMHIFLGTATPKSIWKDVVLAKLLEEGVVVKEEVILTSPLDRTQTYTVLHLSDTQYNPPVCSVPASVVDDAAASESTGNE